MTDNTLFKYTSDFLQKLRWSNRAEAQAALSMVTAYSKDFGNSAEERKLYSEAATIIRRWLKDFATDQRGRARNAPLSRLQHHVTGAIQRGEKVAITEIKKNPATEIRELILFAENSERLTNQFTSIMKNLEKKAAKGTYDPVLAAKLWKYWIDNAVKEYNYEFLTRKRSLVQNVFSVQDRKDAAVQVEAQWRDDVMRGDNPKKKNPAKAKLQWHTFGGGTGAAPGKNAYQSSQTDFGQYMIDPISWDNGRHRYFITKFVNNRGARPGGLHQTLATGNVNLGKRIAREHYERISRGLEPVSELHARVNKGGSFTENPKARKKNPAKKTYFAFLCDEKGQVLYAYITDSVKPRVGISDEKNTAAIFQTKAQAMAVAKLIAEEWPGYQAGVAPTTATVAQIRAGCKRGK